MRNVRPVRAFLEASLPPWLVLGLLLWQGRGHMDMGLAGLAALLFAGVWPAVRLRPIAGGFARRAALYLLFGVAVAAGQVVVLLLVAATARRLPGAPAGPGTNTPLQLFLMFLVLTTAPFLVIRALLALPGAVHRVGWHRLLRRALGAGALGLVGLGLAGGGLYVLFSPPYVGHDGGKPPAVAASTALSIAGTGWRSASPGLALTPAGSAVEAIFNPTEPASLGYFSMTHPWPAGSAAGGNALRVRASSDAEFYLVARVTLADGSAYEAEANLPAGDEQNLMLEPFLPAFDTPASPAGLNWERVIDLTLFAYPAPTQSAAARLEVLGVDVVDVAPSRAWIEARSDHFLVWHHAGDESAAQVALRALEERYTTLAAVTGMSPGGRVPILLAADHAELERLQGERLSAWMIGGSLHSSVMLLTPRRYSLIYNGKQAERFPEVASHEVTHLLVARAASYRGMWAMPVWLHEGLAVYVAGQDAAEVDSLRRAASRGQLPALAELAGEAGFRQQARWAYPMAGEVVRYLAETYGPETLGTLQQAFREGQAADAALQAVYGLSTDALDAEWRAALAGTP